jgi:hypothetical protein
MWLQERDWQKQQCNEETQNGTNARTMDTRAQEPGQPHPSAPLMMTLCARSRVFFSFFYVAKFCQLANQKIQKWLKICGSFRFLVAKFREILLFISLKNRQISLLGSFIEPKINSPIFPKKFLFFSLKNLQICL